MLSWPYLFQGNTALLGSADKFLLDIRVHKVAGREKRAQVDA
jgi:hypothetical protein